MARPKKPGTPARRRAPARPELDTEDPFAAIEHPRQRAFLLAYCEIGAVVDAARAAGCSPRIHYHWMETEAKYRDAFKLAQEVAADELEAVAVRRARDGLEEPVIYQGRIMGRWVLRDGSEAPVTYNPDGSLHRVPRGARFEPLVVPKRSDQLLKFLLEGARPEKFAPRLRGELTGAGGGPVQMSAGVMLTHGTMSEEQWMREHGSDQAHTGEDGDDE